MRIRGAKVLAAKDTVTAAPVQRNYWKVWKVGNTQYSSRTSPRVKRNHGIRTHQVSIVVLVQARLCVESLRLSITHLCGVNVEDTARGYRQTAVVVGPWDRGSTIYGE